MRTSHVELPLWPLPLLVALIPFVAAHIAYAVSIDASLVPSCIPYLEGCTSISRAARHGLGNHLFRLMMLPSALLLALHWWSTRHWLQQHHDVANVGRNLLWLAPFAGAALATYVTFLGTDGDIYRWLRQHGAQLYFVSVYLAQLVFLHRYRQIAWHDRRIFGGMASINLIMLLLGIAYTAVANTFSDPALKDRMENLLEWHIGLLMTLWYLLQTIVWKRTTFRLNFASTASP